VNNTDQAYRIDNGVVLFNGVPVNRFSDPTMFPDSQTSFLDAGLGLGWLDPYSVDPQTAIPVTFNGAAILGSGMSGTQYQLDLDRLGSGSGSFRFTPPATGTFTFEVTANGISGTMEFDSAGLVAGSGDGANLFGYTTNIDGTITITPNDTDYRTTITPTGSDRATNLDAVTHEIFVTLGNRQQNISFQTGADSEETVRNLNTELQRFFGNTITVTNQGNFISNDMIHDLAVHAQAGSLSQGLGIIGETPGGGFPNNIIQLTLDAARSVRAGTDELTAKYADLVFAAGSSLSLAIANIGSEQKFIEFNQERLMNNMLSLREQENFLEYPDMGETIMQQKILEMIYNATLQMSAATIPMSIFSFMR
jgi:flagellin-like hook-associated protein FlgL